MSIRSSKVTAPEEGIERGGGVPKRNSQISSRVEPLNVGCVGCVPPPPVVGARNRAFSSSGAVCNCGVCDESVELDTFELKLPLLPIALMTS